MKQKYYSNNFTSAGLCLALSLLLPIFTGQIPKIGMMLLPMHLTIFVCGLICLPFYTMVVGFIAPILRFLIFGTPVLFPIGIAMSFELAVYGLVFKPLYKALKKIINYKLIIYITLIMTIICGRITWGFIMLIISLNSNTFFDFRIFINLAIINTIPGVIIQLLLVPLIFNMFNKVGNRNDF